MIRKVFGFVICLIMTAFVVDQAQASTVTVCVTKAHYGVLDIARGKLMVVIEVKDPKTHKSSALDFRSDGIYHVLSSNVTELNPQEVAIYAGIAGVLGQAARNHLPVTISSNPHEDGKVYEIDVAWSASCS